MKMVCYDHDILSDKLFLPIGKFKIGFHDCFFYDVLRLRKIAVSIWHPTFSLPVSMVYLNSLMGEAAWCPEVAEGKFPVLMFSHGSDGHRFNQYYLAEYLASHGYIIVSVEHPGNHAFDNSLSCSIDNLYHRPMDISFVLDQLSSSFISTHIDFNHIGFVGHSFGAYTGLILAGAIPDYKCLSQQFSQTHNIKKYQSLSLINTRIKGYFLMAPALSEAFSKKSLNHFNKNLVLVISGCDEYLQDDNIFFMKQLNFADIIINFVDAGHYVYLMCCPDSMKVANEESCKDLSVSRESVHPYLKWHSLSFFNKILKYV